VSVSFVVQSHNPKPVPLQSRAISDGALRLARLRASLRQRRLGLVHAEARTVAISFNTREFPLCGLQFADAQIERRLRAKLERH
jgi:hypothetical protein